MPVIGTPESLCTWIIKQKFQLTSWSMYSDNYIHVMSVLCMFQKNPVQSIRNSYRINEGINHIIELMFCFHFCAAYRLVCVSPRAFDPNW